MEELLKALEAYMTQVKESGLSQIEMGAKFIATLKEQNPDLTVQDWMLYQVAFESAGTTLSTLCAIEAKKLEDQENFN